MASLTGGTSGRRAPGANRVSVRVFAITAASIIMMMLVLMIITAAITGTRAKGGPAESEDPLPKKRYLDKMI